MTEAAQEDLRAEGSNAALRKPTAHVGVSVEALAILDDALTSRDWGVRKRAFEELRATGYSPDTVVPRALSLLSDTSQSIRKEARAFLTLGAGNIYELSRAISAARNHPDAAIRMAAAAWLSPNDALGESSRGAGT